MQPRRKQRINPNTVVLLKRIFTGILVLATFALIITAIWYGTRIQALTIDTIEVSGGKTIEHSEVENLAKQQLEGTYLGLIPRQFAWFYSEESIINSLESIERIHDLTISRTSGTVLKITFDEYTPIALWCDNIESEECLFLDNLGYAFATAPKLSGGSFLRFLQVGESAKIHEPYTSPESFASLLSLTKLLAEQDLYISYIELDQVGDAFLSLVGGGEFKVTLKQPPIEIIDNLQVILSSEKFSHLKPGNFKYIDLRFGNKVFVNEELDVPEVEEIISETGSTTVPEETN